MRPIKILDEELRHQILSGYCVDSVLTCVEQLVLNSIEANARSVRVHLDLSFFNITVTDDGRGINQEDLHLAGERYASSKYYEDSSGWGKRGESLASIIALAYLVQIDSKCRCQSQGYGKLFKDQTSRVHPSSTVTTEGTCVSVRNFFHSLPVRRGMVDAIFEMDKIKKMLEEIVVAHPRVSISLYDEANDVWRMKTSHFKSSEAAFCSFYGAQWKSLLQPINTSQGPFNVTGFVATEGYRNRSLQLIYLLKRRVSNIQLQELFNKRLHRLCTNEPFLVFVLLIDCPFNMCTFGYDLTRMTVEFQQFDVLASALDDIVLKLFMQSKVTDAGEASISPLTREIAVKNVSHVVQSLSVKRPISQQVHHNSLYFSSPHLTEERLLISINRKQSSPLELFRNKSERKQRLSNAINDLARFKRPTTNPTQNVDSPSEIKRKRRERLVKLRESVDSSLLKEDEKLSATTSVPVGNSQPCQLTKNHLQNVKVVGQVDCRFIAAVTEYNEDKHLLLFDQHAVHERIRLEKLTEETLSAVELNFPMTLSLDERILELTIQHLDDFTKLGIYFQLKENHLFVNRVPQCFAEKEANQKGTILKLLRNTVEESIESLQMCGTIGSVIPRTIMDLLKSQACHGAIKFGQHLSEEECAQLLQQLSLCKLPFECAHGRPSVVPLLQLPSICTRNRSLETTCCQFKWELCLI